MDGRHILDLRVGTPWSNTALELLARSGRSAWADPSHPASEGRRAATWLEAAQATVSQLTGLPHVTFFASRNEALRAAVGLYPGSRVTAPATHRKPALALADAVLDVDVDGRVIWPDIEVGLAQGANEETGIIDELPSHGIVVLDASNSLGRVAGVPAVDQLIADSASWGAPGGIAFVAGKAPVISDAVPPLPLITLAVQTLAERWLSIAERFQRERAAMQEFRSVVEARIPDVQFHGTEHASHVASFSVLHLDAETLMRALDQEGYVVGSGSACVHDGTPSHVLAAMGRITHGNVRLALPVDLDLDVLTGFAEVLERTVRTLRRDAGVDDL